MQGWLEQAKLFLVRFRQHSLMLKRIAVATLTIVALAATLFGQIRVTHAAIACDVTLTTDGNPPTGNVGELRWAINQANALNCTGNTITFHIGATGSTQTITFTASTPLPSITKPVFIDGTTQDAPGVICNAVTGPKPEIVIDATGIGGTNAALWLDNGSSGSEIKGLAIINAPGQGIFAYTSNDSIDCNYVGLAADGTTAAGNGSTGVEFAKNGVNPSPSNNVIGGTTPTQRNVISSNAGNGIVIHGVGTTNNVVEGNYISTDATGTAARPNGGGTFPAVLIAGGASGNTIGGTTAGVRNVISGNTGSPGVQIDGSGTNNNVVEGNYIGVDPTGTVALANDTGILLTTGATSNTFGGTTAGARNVISGNTSNGIQIDGSGTNNNVVEGNYIGTDTTGIVALPNGAAGILISSGAQSTTIGGTTAGARNIISANTTNGVAIANSGTSNNIVIGNYIGTDVTGTVALGNTTSNVAIFISASNNRVGGTTAGERNIISASGANGVNIHDTGTTGNTVEGNYIGTDKNGTAALPNTGSGVLVSVQATNNTIGGTASGAGNVISGNTSSGVNIRDSGTTGNTVRGNLIGTDNTGTVALPNAGVEGLVIFSGAANNTVGGTTAAARNIISGNTGAGINIDNPGTAGNIVEGNFIGTDISGTAALPNGTAGIVIFASATNNTIGGTTAGARNVISANTSDGISINGIGTSGNTVAGNFIGTDVNGTAALPNGTAGITIFSSATNNTVGGTTAGARNVISGNTVDGLDISNPGTTGNIVEGNYIGTDFSGTVAVPNTQVGISIFSSATNNTIGGTTAGARNVISGNTSDGIAISGAGTTGNIVEGNYIGTDSNGTVAVPNGLIGIAIFSSATNNTIGGTTAGARNVISGNTAAGVGIHDAGTTGNIVEGNFIGTNAAGTALANGGSGVVLFNGATGNFVGGTASGARNLIAFNTTIGVEVANAASTGNAIRGNSIHDNTSLGIDLNSDGVTANDTGDGDPGPNNLQNYPVISSVTASGTNYQISGTFNSTASTAFTVDFYANTVCDPSGNGQGHSYMGSTTVNTDGGGNATFTSVSLPAVGGQQVVTSTATDPGGNTSEFSNCTTGPVVSGAAPPPSFAPQEGVVPVDALTITLTSSEELVVTDGETVTLTATITNTSSSEVDGVSIRMQAADAFDIISTTTSAGIGIVDCQLVSLQLPTLQPGQQIIVTVQVRLNPSAPSNGEADNVLAAEYLGGRLKTAGHKVEVVRRGTLPSTGYPPPADVPINPAVLALLIGVSVLGGTVAAKRVARKRS